MKYALIIFDLDGTSLNTLDDLCFACNQALILNGYPTKSREYIRCSVGSGLTSLIQKVLPDPVDEKTSTKILRDFKSIYAEHLNDHTHPYDGIPQLMTDLKKANIHIAIHSNKIDSAVKTLCAMHFPNMVDMVLGEKPEFGKKPSPSGVKHIIENLGVSPDLTLYVGDSEVDIQTALNAGVDCAWVSWGFRSRSELGDLTPPNAFDTVEALRQYLFGAQA